MTINGHGSIGARRKRDTEMTIDNMRDMNDIVAMCNIEKWKNDDMGRHVGWLEPSKKRNS